MDDVLKQPSAFNKSPLIVAAALVCCVLFVVAASRISGVGTSHLTYQHPLVQRELRFEDQASGSVLVKDAKSGATIEEIVPGNYGFVRMVMRTLAHDRLAAGQGPEAPFLLTRWDDGRLTIADPATSRKIELVGFGSTNVQAFAKYLPQGSTSP